MKTNWKDRCKCGHSKYLHEVKYANDIIKLEGCRLCACLIFIKKNSVEKNKQSGGTKWKKIK